MNKLEYILTLVQEECAELSQRAAKIQRFGLDNIGPGKTETNIELLEQEAIDVMTTLSMLDSYLGNPMAMFNDPKIFEIAMGDKLKKIAKYMDYSREIGLLQ